MMYMFALTFIYIALAWYFAQIYSKGAKKKLFCLSYKYWACIIRKHKEHGKKKLSLMGIVLTRKELKVNEKIVYECTICRNHLKMSQH